MKKCSLAQCPRSVLVFSCILHAPQHADVIATAMLMTGVGFDHTNIIAKATLYAAWLAFNPNCNTVEVPTDNDPKYDTVEKVPSQDRISLTLRKEEVGKKINKVLAAVGLNALEKFTINQELAKESDACTWARESKIVQFNKAGFRSTLTRNFAPYSFHDESDKERFQQLALKLCYTTDKRSKQAKVDKAGAERGGDKVEQGAAQEVGVESGERGGKEEMEGIAPLQPHAPSTTPGAPSTTLPTTPGPATPGHQWKHRSQEFSSPDRMYVTENPHVTILFCPTRLPPLGKDAITVIPSADSVIITTKTAIPSHPELDDRGRTPIFEVTSWDSGGRRMKTIECMQCQLGAILKITLVASTSMQVRVQCYCYYWLLHREPFAFQIKGKLGGFDTAHHSLSHSKKASEVPSARKRTFQFVL